MEHQAVGEALSDVVARVECDAHGRSDAGEAQPPVAGAQRAAAAALQHKCQAVARRWGAISGHLEGELETHATGRGDVDL